MKLLIALLLFAPAVMAAVIHGTDGGNPPATNAVRVNSSGQLSLTKLAGENQTLDIVETSVAGPGSSASANISTATSTEVCDPTGSGASDPVFRVYANVIEHADVATSKCISKTSAHFTGVHITNNTLVGCGYGFYTSTNPETPASSTFSNNAISGANVAWHIQKATITGITAAQNAVFGAGASPYCTGTTPTCSSTPQAQFTGTITDDPLLDADGKPAAGSPLVNAGTCPLSVGCAHGDYRGRTRGSDPDIGAYELSGRDAIGARTASAAREAATRVAATSRTAQ